MATFEILAAFALSLAFMLLLWSLKDFLFKPQRAQKELKLTVLITANDDGAPLAGGCPAQNGAEDPVSAEAAENRNQSIRSDGNDGGNG